MGHIELLASDKFEGRAPGTAGEEKTVAYLVEQAKKIRTVAGQPRRHVPPESAAVGITAVPRSPLTFAKGEQKLELAWRDDAVVWTKHVADSARIDGSEVVFVGYGIEAPEYRWDDFKGTDPRARCW